MIEQKVINKNGKVFTKIKTSKNIKSSFEQLSLSMLLINYKCIDKFSSVLLSLEPDTYSL